MSGELVEALRSTEKSASLASCANARVNAAMPLRSRKIRARVQRPAERGRGKASRDWALPGQALRARAEDPAAGSPKERGSAPARGGIRDGAGTAVARRKASVELAVQKPELANELRAYLQGVQL